MKTFTVALCAMIGLAQQGYCDVIGAEHEHNLWEKPQIEMI